ncbi:peptidyl-prolyl cis-trans isomerase, cyclophilin type [Luminiphilus syltensis NOR5-1B]|uniref:peptidylprolyl isomerase n=1 Tax=Luminiphilus syltensis NOR5-1B TaxID=565045 RepID=B8KTS5_9GAMM|nr:peptidylprolyl isomerase [Luminiphilus syltensis]EED36565.1 peptidyl-prolyl cis-trans isomerase, cyclophilin type [Luminiphilus syltensis NOR5-1B]
MITHRPNEPHAFLRPLRLLALLTLLGAPVSTWADTHRVSMVTEAGTIELALDADVAPVTVANFLSYIDAGAFEGGSFYRTVSPENDNGSPPISVIQGGAREDAPRMAPIAHESTEDTGILHRDGVISMGRYEVGSADAEFFICIGDQPGLDFGAVRNPDKQGFAAFGRVVEGMAVVRDIHGRATDSAADDPYVANQLLREPVLIESVTVTPIIKQ